MATTHPARATAAAQPNRAVTYAHRGALASPAIHSAIPSTINSNIAQRSYRRLVALSIRRHQLSNLK